MILQKASRFALFAMLELAAEPSRRLSTAEIADKYGISAHHLAKVLRVLGRAGLLEAERGAQGGYRLARDSGAVTLLDVIQLFEIVDPIARGDSADGGTTPEGQALRQILGDIEDTARATFATISLDGLLRLAAKRG